jgi:exosome complex component RRP42
VENSTSISRDLEGRGADAVNVEHTQGLQRVLVQSNVIDLDKLCIVEGKYVWTIYVDILVLDSGGNLFDIIILAAYTALCNTKIPNVEIIPAETIEETEFDIIDDPAAATSLDVASVPVCITLSKMGTRYVVDTTLEEEACVDSKLLISVKRNGTICGMQKTGMGAIDINSTYSLFQWSRTIGKTLFEKIDEALKIERSRDSTIITDTVMEKLNLFY